MSETDTTAVSGSRSQTRPIQWSCLAARTQVCLVPSPFLNRHHHRRSDRAQISGRTGSAIC